MSEQIVDLGGVPYLARVAIEAIIEFADNVDSIGYSPEYFRQDLPGVVAKALGSEAVRFREITPTELANLTGRKIPEYIAQELQRAMDMDKREQND